MTLDAERHLPRFPALFSLAAVPLARGVAAGLLLIVAGCGGGDSAPSTPPATYTIGGSIGGLNAAGLVLVNGTSTVSVPASATGFVFPTPVSSGTAYNVSVQASPTGLQCSVAGGAGTVQTANVSSIAVTCAATAYAIGGAVSGLTAAGLVLQNGNDMVSVASGATSYTLPTLVAPTSTYNITVQAEPASGVYCSVSNGTGTMPAHSVANANVSCSTQPFTVGGSVTGLNGSGLVLANGTDTVTVPVNATSFSIPATFGTPYAITVQTPPAGLTCAVSSGSGTMPAANVVSVQVACSDQTFNLSGTVTGLTSAGLVLANGSTMVPVASGASGYAFVVPYTSAYHITVQTPPTGLTCSVANASGTMPANDQNGVDVTCSVNSYQVGGSISGLRGTGLVLINNGGDPLTVPANATSYHMPHSVAYQGAYNVTIQTQPRYYTCSVSNGSVSDGSGTVGAGDVTDANIRCVQNAEYAYSQDFNTDNILIYSVDASSHQLSSTASTFSTGAGTGPVSVVVNPASTMLYAVDAGTSVVSWYNIDPATGLLSAPNANTIGTGGGYPKQLLFNAAGTLAWAVNSTGNSIQAFHVNNDGSLSASGSPVPTVNHNPNSLTLHPSLPLLYVTDSSSSGVITWYSFDASTGVVSFNNAAPAADLNQYQLVFNAAGTYAYAAARDASFVDEYQVDGLGNLGYLTSIATSGTHPQSLTLDPTGSYLYTADNASTDVSAFTVDSSSGLLSLIGPFPAYAGPATVTVDPVNGYLFVVNSGGDDTHAIAWYSISSASGTAGQLTAVGTATSPAGTFPSVLSFATP